MRFHKKEISRKCESKTSADSNSSDQIWDFTQEVKWVDHKLFRKNDGNREQDEDPWREFGGRHHYWEDPSIDDNKI